MEQLEARTVLSASVDVTPMGPVPGDIASAASENSLAVAAWATGQWSELRPGLDGSVVIHGIQLTAQPPQFSDAISAGFVGHSPPPRVSAQADGYPAFDVSPAAGFHHAHGGLPQHAAPPGLSMAPNIGTLGKPPGPFSGGWQNSLVPVFVVRIYSTITTDIEAPSNRLPELELPPPVRSQAAPAPTDAPRPIFSTAPTVPKPSPARVNNPATSRAALAAAASISSLYSSSNATTRTASSTSVVSLGAHAAAFQEYSSKQLLLVENSNDSTEIDRHNDAEDGWKITDKRENEVAECDDSILREDVASSLHALQRERDAIDQVLAQLHDLEPSVDEHGADAARAQKRGDSEPPLSADEPRFPADEPNNQPTTSHHNSGGMVLLQPSGDANSSAYDLTAVILKGVDKSTEPSTETEAAVGVYQAFDVSTAELRTTDANEAPLTKPTAAIRRGISSADESGA